MLSFFKEKASKVPILSVLSRLISSVGLFCAADGAECRVGGELLAAFITVFYTRGGGVVDRFGDVRVFCYIIIYIAHNGVGVSSVLSPVDDLRGKCAFGKNLDVYRIFCDGGEGDCDLLSPRREGHAVMVAIPYTRGGRIFGF